jgi:hypothetical protein
VKGQTWIPSVNEQALDWRANFRRHDVEPYKQSKLHGLSPRVNYTDQAIAACRRS